MDGLMKRLKPLTSLSLFSLLLLMACMVFYLCTNPLYTTSKSWLWATTFRQGDAELEKVLKNASMPDKTVILTTLNEAWAGPGSVIDLFLESFRVGEGTPRLLNHLVIVAMDEKAFTRCQAIHSHCFYLATPGINFSSEKRFMTPDYLRLMWRRIDFLRIVLQLGYNFVFTDTDIMWFRDPFPYFDRHIDFQIACDFYNGSPKNTMNKANGGLNYVKSSKATISFYEYWHKARINHPNLHDQAVFEIIKHEKIVKKTGLTIEYLDTMHFGGFCQPSKDMTKVFTMHANCCVGIERKIHDLGLILGDWKNFTAVSLRERKPQQLIILTQSSPWRAPDKCKQWS